MEIEFLLDKKDLIAYAQYQRRATNRVIQQRIWAAKLFWWFIIPCIVAGGFVIEGSMSGGVLFVYVGLICALVLWQKWYLRKYFNVVYSEEFSKGATGKRKFFIDKEFFIETTEMKETHYLWNAIEQIVDGPAHIFICPNKISAFIVPHRAFQKESDFQAFRQELENRWRAGRSAPDDLTFSASAK